MLESDSGGRGADAGQPWVCYGSSKPTLSAHAWGVRLKGEVGGSHLRFKTVVDYGQFGEGVVRNPVKAVRRAPVGGPEDIGQRLNIGVTRETERARAFL